MGIGSQLGEHILQPVIQRAGSELGKDAMYGINYKNRSDDEVYNGLKPLKTQYSIVPLFHYSNCERSELSSIIISQINTHLF